MNQETRIKSAVAFQRMFCGFYELNQSIEKGILLFGKTKAGKTTSLQFMRHSVLVGYENNETKAVTYRFKIGEKGLQQAKVGDHQWKSETQIPNLFKFQQVGKQKQTIFGIDFPGFADSYGFFRSISNKLYISRVFEIVKKIKFVLVIAFHDLQKGADNMLSTFKSFFETFQNISSILGQINKSVSLLVTSTPNNLNEKDVINKFKGSPDKILGLNNDCFLKLKNQIIKNERVFIFKQAIKDKQAEGAQKSRLFQQINQKMNWWERPVGPDDKPSMKEIKITVKDMSQSIKNNKEFLAQLSSFSVFLKERFQFSFKKNNNGIKQLAEYFVQNWKTMKPQKLQYKAGYFVKEFEQHKRQLIKNDTEYQRLQNKYKDRREAQKNILFSADSSSSDSNKNQNKVALQIQNAKIMIKLYEIDQKSLGVENIRSFQSTSQYIKMIHQILSIFNHYLKKNDRESPTFKDYSFLMYSQVNMINQIYKILFNTALDMKENKGMQECLSRPQLKFIYQQYPTQFNKIFGFFKQHADLILSNYLQNIDPDQILSDNSLYPGHIAFIKQMIERFKVKDIKDDKLLNHLNKIHQSYEDRILQYKIFTECQKYSPKNQQYMKNLHQKSIEVQKQIKDQIVESKDNFDELLNKKTKILQLMAYIFNQQEKWQQACSIYQSLNDAHKVLTIYLKKQQTEMKFDEKEPKTAKQMIIFLTKFMKKAYKYGRVQLAIEKAQKAFSIAQLIGDSKRQQKIGKFLYRICPVDYEETSGPDQQQNQKQDLQNIESGRRQYIQRMNNGLNIVSLTQPAQNKIKEYIQQQKLRKKDSQRNKASPLKDSRKSKKQTD